MKYPHTLLLLSFSAFTLGGCAAETDDSSDEGSDGMDTIDETEDALSAKKARSDLYLTAGFGSSQSCIRTELVDAKGKGTGKVTYFCRDIKLKTKSFVPKRMVYVGKGDIEGGDYYMAVESDGTIWEGCSRKSGARTSTTCTIRADYSSLRLLSTNSGDWIKKADAKMGKKLKCAVSIAEAIGTKAKDLVLSGENADFIGAYKDVKSNCF